MRETLALLLALAIPSAQHLPTLVAIAPTATLTLQVARTEMQREVGLMNVTSLPEHTGMVFVFPQDGPVAFWMKDTLIPLDMVFVASDGRVRSVAVRVPIVPLTSIEQIGAFLDQLAAWIASAAHSGKKPAIHIRR